MKQESRQIEMRKYKGIKNNKIKAKAEISSKRKNAKEPYQTKWLTRLNRKAIESTMK